MRNNSNYIERIDLITGETYRLVKCIDPKGTPGQHARESVFQNPENVCLWNPDYCLRNSTNDWNPESKFH